MENPSLPSRAADLVRLLIGPIIEQMSGMLFNPIQFDLLELLGEGGQGRVYKALRRDRRTGLSQIVALKVLNSQTAVELWRREFESLSRVRSNYCVQVLSFERFRGRPALVLELVEGLSLAQLGQGCWLTPHEIEEILAQLELALKVLRDHRIFHGDLSPHNILVDTSGRVRVLDFGLANFGDERQLRLTPEFAAPERLRGAAPDVYSDLFSLGRIEQFLRGSTACPVDYMNPHASSRRFRELTIHAAHQAALARTVQELWNRRRLNTSAKTRTQTRGKSKRTFIKEFVWGLIASFLIITTSSATQTHRYESWGTLKIVTRKWCHLKINGRDAGYAPLSFNLPAGSDYRIEWDSAEGQGSKRIHVRAHQVQVLTDRDFSH